MTETHTSFNTGYEALKDTCPLHLLAFPHDSSCYSPMKSSSDTQPKFLLRGSVPSCPPREPGVCTVHAHRRTPSTWVSTPSPCVLVGALVPRKHPIDSCRAILTGHRTSSMYSSADARAPGRCRGDGRLERWWNGRERAGL